MRFVPAEAEPYLLAVETHGRPVGHPRRTAVHVLVRAYGSGSRLLTGLGLWLALVLCVLGAAAGATTAVLGLRSQGGAAEVAGGLLGTAPALALGTWAALRGRDLIRAGARISRAAEAWMTAVPEPRQGLAHGAHALLSSLRPEVYPRVILSSLAALATVVLLGVAGFSLAGATGRGGPGDEVVGVVMGLACLVLAAVCAVPAVALWRGSSRIQRGLVKDPGAMA